MKGKLEKRITKLLTDNFNSDVGDGYTSPKDIVEIINKAGKKFPKRRKFFAGEKIEDTWARLSREREEWFKEYFGDEKQ